MQELTVARAEFSVEEQDASAVMRTQFYLPNTFSTQESVFEAPIEPGSRESTWVLIGIGSHERLSPAKLLISPGAEVKLQARDNSLIQLPV